MGLENDWYKYIYLISHNPLISMAYICTLSAHSTESAFFEAQHELRLEKATHFKTWTRLEKAKLSFKAWTIMEKANWYLEKTLLKYVWTRLEKADHSFKAQHRLDEAHFYQITTQTGGIRSLYKAWMIELILEKPFNLEYKANTTQQFSPVGLNIPLRLWAVRQENLSVLLRTSSATNKCANIKLTYRIYN